MNNRSDAYHLSSRLQGKRSKIRGQMAKLHVQTNSKVFVVPTLMIEQSVTILFSQSFLSIMHLHSDSFSVPGCKVDSMNPFISATCATGWLLHKCHQGGKTWRPQKIPKLLALSMYFNISRTKQQRTFREHIENTQRALRLRLENTSLTERTHVS